MEKEKERRKKRRNYNKEENKKVTVSITKISDDEIEVITDEEDDSSKKNKIKEKSKLKKGEKIFIIINVLIIISLIAYYGYRTFFYYNREHKVGDVITLKEKVTNIKNITYKDDGLYEKNNYFYFKGKNVNNYVYYSGRMFRIISIDQNIKMIEDNSVTNLVYGFNSTYDKSLIYNWLNDYLQTYKDYDIYLLENMWCNKDVDINNYNCDDNLKNYIGLLSTKEYLDAGGVDSYLNNGVFYWTINHDKESAYFVNSSGNINNYVKDDADNYFSYGIRPVINLKGDLLYVKGNGTKENPYIVEENTPSLLNNSSVGSYVKYKNMIYRIINIDEKGVSLVTNTNLEIGKKYNDAIKYLNSDYIGEFNKNDLVEQELITNYYSKENNYNYKENIKNEKYYVTVPKIGDLFINSGNGYWLNTLSDKKNDAYYILDDGMLYGDLKSGIHKLKPIIKLRGDLIIKEGIGTEDVPLVLE